MVFVRVSHGVTHRMAHVVRRLLHMLFSLAMRAFRIIVDGSVVRHARDKICMRPKSLQNKFIAKQQKLHTKYMGKVFPVNATWGWEAVSVAQIVRNENITEKIRTAGVRCNGWNHVSACDENNLPENKIEKKTTKNAAEAKARRMKCVTCWLLLLV